MENEKHDDFRFERAFLECFPLALLFAFFAVLLCFSIKSFCSCADVIRWTIPAGYFPKVQEFSLTTYLRETGLRQHVLSMPPSAKKYFILHGTAFFTHAILAVACVGAAIRYQQRHKHIGSPEEREENSGNFAPDSNRFAFSLVNSIAGRGGRSPYNPIFFYGRPGADLAGFLRMIEARFSEAGDKRQILYAKCSELAKIDGSALRSTVLIVDDAQNLTDGSELQVHLMKCLTELCRTDNQVILAGTCQADQISNLADGIMEQFETALIAGIQQE